MVSRMPLKLVRACWGKLGDASRYPQHVFWTRKRPATSQKVRQVNFHLLGEKSSTFEKNENFRKFSSTKSPFSWRQKSKMVSRMPLKLVQDYSAKSGDTFQYPERLVSTTGSDSTILMKNGKMSTWATFWRLLQYSIFNAKPNYKV